MKNIPLYRYEREPGKTTVSPIKPDCECEELTRLVAEEGKRLTSDGVNLCSVIDVDDPSGWYEVDAPPDTEEGGEGVIE